MLELRYFTMLCNNAVYKRMGKDVSLGQLYKRQNKIKILYKAKVGPTTYTFPTTQVQYRSHIQKILIVLVSINTLAYCALL
jgi:hypothetical protein